MKKTKKDYLLEGARIVSADKVIDWNKFVEDALINQQEKELYLLLLYLKTIDSHELAYTDLVTMLNVRDYRAKDFILTGIYRFSNDGDNFFKAYFNPEEYNKMRVDNLIKEGYSYIDPSKHDEWREFVLDCMNNKFYKEVIVESMLDIIKNYREGKSQEAIIVLEDSVAHCGNIFVEKLLYFYPDTIELFSKDRDSKNINKQFINKK